MTRILYLGEDPDLGQFLMLILEREGYESLLSANSYEAWALLHSLPVDLFIQDMSQLDIAGEEFYVLIRADQALQDLPLVIMSARNTVQDDIPGLQADAHIIKPFGVEEFLQTIAAILAHWGKPGLTAAEQAWGQAQYKQYKQGVSQPENWKMLAMIRLHARLWAIRGANRYQDGIEIESLVQLLTAGDVETRLKVAHDLGLVGDRTMVEPLRRVLAEDVWSVRWAAAQSLGQLKAVEVLPVLVAILTDEQPIVRLMAALALAKIGDPAAVQPLMATLARETDPVACRAMAIALQRLR